VVLVPLEDGDRAEALGEMGKTELVIDLNPMSRSATVATVPVIDNVVRALPNIADHARTLRTENADLGRIVDGFDPDRAREAAENRLRQGRLGD
jgi:pantothenate synthetase (EC 6.3.2.1)